LRVELEIDNELARRLFHLTKETSMAEAVRGVVADFVRRETAKRFRDMGSVEFDPEYLAELEREHPTGRLGHAEKSS
jgi:hypothetical protein